MRIEASAPLTCSVDLPIEIESREASTADC